MERSPRAITRGMWLHVLALAAFEPPTVEPAAVARVRAWLQRDASMLPREALAPDVRFEGDLCSISGAYAYSTAAARWASDAE